MIGNLGPGPEFDAIRSILRRLGSRAAGIGDDAAVTDIPRGDRLVASVDCAIEGTHFRRDWLTPREIGHRAVVAALSDLAAMAATPIGVLVAIVLPDSWKAALDDLADGIADAASDADTHVLGGNLSGGDDLSITTTVFGSAFAPLLRSAAKPGDTLYVTGRLGAAKEALDRLNGGHDAGPFRERFAAPSARLGEARWLAERGASAAIDVSDGLVADLGHLAAASRVHIELDVLKVPRVDGVSLDTALTSGEEYELIVASSVSIDAGAFEARFGIPVSAIGRAAAGSAGVEVIGARVAATSGYDHFSR